MKSILFVCALVFALAVSAPPAHAADGSVVINQTLLRVDAIAGEENCSFFGPVEQNILVACFVDDHIKQIHSYKPVPGGAAIHGDFDDVNNAISWTLSETSDGKFRWEIHANKTVQTGQF